MDNTIGSQSGQFFTRDTFYGFRTPISTYIGEDLCPVGEQVTEKHSHPIASIIFRSHDICFPNAIPVEGCIQLGFRIVSVRVKVSPLALSLETGSYRIMP